MNPSTDQQILMFLAHNGVSSSQLLSQWLHCTPLQAEALLQPLLEMKLIRLYPHLPHWSGLARFSFYKPDQNANFTAPEAPDRLWCLTTTAHRRLDIPAAKIPALRALDHHLLLQALQIQSLQQGWVQQWWNERHTRIQHWAKVPDALCLAPLGQRLALELELSLKAPWRYQEALEHYALLFHEQHIDYVIYLVPDHLATRLRRQLLHIDLMYLLGQMLAVPEQLRSRFRVLSLHTALSQGLHAAFLQS